MDFALFVLETVYSALCEKCVLIFVILICDVTWNFTNPTNFLFLSLRSDGERSEAHHQVTEN